MANGYQVLDLQGIDLVIDDYTDIPEGSYEVIEGSTKAIMLSGIVVDGVDIKPEYVQPYVVDGAYVFVLGKYKITITAEDRCKVELASEGGSGIENATLGYGTNAGGDPTINLEYEEGGETFNSQIALDPDKFEVSNNHLTVKGGGDLFRYEVYGEGTNNTSFNGTFVSTDKELSSKENLTLQDIIENFDKVMFVAGSAVQGSGNIGFISSVYASEGILYVRYVIIATGSGQMIVAGLNSAEITKSKV